MSRTKGFVSMKVGSSPDIKSDVVIHSEPRIKPAVYNASSLERKINPRNKETLPSKIDEPEHVYASNMNINMHQSYFIGQSVFNHIISLLPEMIEDQLRQNSMFDSPSYSSENVHSTGGTAKMQADLENKFSVKLNSMFEDTIACINTKVDSQLASIGKAKEALEDRMKECADAVNNTLQTELLEINNLKASLNAYAEEKRVVEVSSNADERQNVPSQPIIERIASIERVCEQLTVGADKQEQYTRLETREFKNILPEPDPRTGEEDTTEVLVKFCRRYLNIHINKYDISISHRMPIAAEKKRVGKDYIPPIYCRFVNRSVAMLIMKRKRLLKNARNRLGQKFFIEENLTLQRRLLKDRAENQLHSYHFKWVKNGNIFVRKHRRSNPIKISSEKILDELIHEQNTSKRTKENENFNSHRVNLNRDRSNNIYEHTHALRIARSRSSEFPYLPRLPARRQNVSPNFAYDWYDNYNNAYSYSSVVAPPRSSERNFNNYSPYR